MAGQIDRLIAVTQLPNVRFGIVPSGIDLPAPAQHGFWLFDDGLLYIEVLHTELTTRDADDVQLYRDYLAALWTADAEGEDARATLLRVQSDLAQTG